MAFPVSVMVIILFPLKAKIQVSPVGTLFIVMAFPVIMFPENIAPLSVMVSIVLILPSFLMLSSWNQERGL